MNSILGFELLSRFILSFSAILVVARCYYHFHKHREYAASFILFGNGVFFVTALLHNIDISMGFAFGLFAIFSMLRYRTESIGVQEMTYLFLVIAISLLSAVSKISFEQLTFIILLVLAITYILETNLILKKNYEQVIEYEKIENIQPANREALIADLQQRIGLEIIDVRIISVSFLRDTAMLRVRFNGDNSH